MNQVEQLQAYLRHSAARQYRVDNVPPFTIFTNPYDPFPSFNYAIPDCPVGGFFGEELPRLRSTFQNLQRQPRFEFIEEFAPRLAPVLSQNGFVREGSYPLMICSPASFRPVSMPPLPGLGIRRLTTASTTTEARAFILTQSRGFDPPSSFEPDKGWIERVLQNFEILRSFVVYLESLPVGVGVYTAPHNGLAELAGITTLSEYRGRGIASYLTAVMVREAFKEGVDLALLSAADVRSGRVYEKIGFRSVVTVLAFNEPPAKIEPALLGVVSVNLISGSCVKES